MTSEKRELQSSFQHLRALMDDLQQEFNGVDIHIRQDDLLSFLGIPATVAPEFQDPTNLQNLLFFDFVNQGFALFLVSEIESNSERLQGPLLRTIDDIQEKYGLQVIFHPNVIGELDKASPALCQKLFAIFTNLDLQDFLSLDLFGSLLQNFLSQATRKRFAANYTILDAAELLAYLVVTPQVQCLVDPMGGSGRLLFTSLDAFQSQAIPLDQALPRMVLNELFLPAVQLFYTKLLIRILHESPGDLGLASRCLVGVGDAFRNFFSQGSKGEDDPPTDLSHFVGTCDLVIMNPPFTRQGLLEPNYRVFLTERFKEYAPFLNRHMGLHGYAIFLAHELLRPGGTIAAVLPAATIYSGYGRGLKEFLLRHYHIQVILTSAVIKAFSEGSDFRELILICQQFPLADREGVASTRSRLPVKFVSVKPPMGTLALPELAVQINAITHSQETDALKVSFVLQDELESDMNWLYFFESTDFKDLHADLTLHHPFMSSNGAGFRLVRGFEMYGPNYFLLPNKYWHFVSESENNVTFSSTDHGQSACEITIPREFLIKSLRKPQECEPRITFEPSHYALAIPKAAYISADLEIYMQWGLKLAIPAIKRFGSDWLHHVHAQLASKQPYGRVFVADKISVNGLHNFAYFFPDSITCTKNFYVFQTGDPSSDEFLAAWLNSAIFFFLFLAERREIGGSYGRLQIADYKVMPLFVPIDLANPTFQTVLDAFRGLQGIAPLPLLQVQFTLPERITLDNAILTYIGFFPPELEDVRERIYATITQKLQALEARD